MNFVKNKFLDEKNKPHQNVKEPLYEMKQKKTKKNKTKQRTNKVTKLQNQFRIKKIPILNIWSKVVFAMQLFSKDSVFSCVVIF